MKKTSVIMPLFVAAVGAAGFYLRQLELIYVFDAQTGLNERGATITTALITLTVLLLLFAFIFSLKVGFSCNVPRGFSNIYGTDSIAYPFIISIISLVWMGGTAISAIDLNASNNFQTGELYFTILSAVSALCFIIFSIDMFRAPDRKGATALILVPIMFMTFWLIFMYRDNASNPILLSYSYHALAVIFSALSFYYISAFIFSKPYPGKAVFTSLSAIFFCFVTLADTHNLGISLIFISIIAINVVHLTMLVRNLLPKAPKFEI